jgi:hypothetical protein
MAWKSITFKKASADGRFTSKDAKASGTVSPSPKGVKTSNGDTTEGWSVKGSSTGGTKEPNAGEAKSASTQAVAKHRDAMTGVILDARKLADERRTTLNSIKDPDLKRSAAR